MLLCGRGVAPWRRSVSSMRRNVLAAHAPPPPTVTHTHLAGPLSGNGAVDVAVASRAGVQILSYGVAWARGQQGNWPDALLRVPAVRARPPRPRDALGVQRNLARTAARLAASVANTLVAKHAGEC